MTSLLTDPCVSVVIPCYNAERWIESTLQSVQKQTWKNIQLVVVNDDAEPRVLVTRVVEGVDPLCQALTVMR